MTLTRHLKYAAGFTTLLVAGCITFTTTATEAWQLQDLRNTLTSRAQQALRFVASRGSDWLVSDGQNLWKVSSSGETSDYTDKVRSRGELQGMGSDGSSYLLAWNQANSTAFSQMKSDGTWQDLSLRLNDRRIRSIHGLAGRYIITSEERFANSPSLPKTWTLTTWQEGSNPETVSLPTGASSFVPGCTIDGYGGSVCASAGTLLPLNGEWYLLAGEAETRTRDGKTSQAAKAHMWRWTGGTTFEPVTSFPEARFISGAWAGTGELLIATSNAVTNPFAADTYWTFTGSRFQKHQTGPLAAGMLSVDTRSLHAAWNGSGWTIAAGNTLVRLEKRTFSVEGVLRDKPLALGGSSNGSSLILGQRGSFDGTVSPEPSIALIAKTVAFNDTSALIHPRELPHPNSLTNFTLGSTPEPATINNGSSFTFRVTADDADGVDHIDILVRGARVKTCASATCSYTQAFWTQNATTTEVLFTARVHDRLGAVSQSEDYRLTILDTAVLAPSMPATTPGEGRMPAGLAWGRDAHSGINFTTWLNTTSTLFSASDIRLYSVAAGPVENVRTIEIWVNGRAERTCTQDHENGLAFCSLPLLGSNYLPGAEVFVNARLITPQGRETWTPGTRLQR